MPYNVVAMNRDIGKRVRVMGILNVTPDSFSDGGRFVDPADVSAQVEAMLAAGADFIDVGGESSRPFADPVSLAEELHRVLPAIAMIRDQSSTIPVSIDTTKAEVARQALASGADLVNDISAMRFDPDMVEVLRHSGAPVILMHMQGTPGTMQLDPVYDDVVGDVIGFFEERLAWAVDQGLDRDQLIIDPGIGFGKTVTHNLTILKHLDAFQHLNCPVLVGHSRKSFIGKILDIEATDERDCATAALAALCVREGVDILRVHDVGKTAQAVRLAEAVLAAP